MTMYFRFSNLTIAYSKGAIRLILRESLREIATRLSLEVRSSLTGGPTPDAQEALYDIHSHLIDEHDYTYAIYTEGMLRSSSVLNQLTFFNQLYRMTRRSYDPRTKLTSDFPEVALNYMRLSNVPIGDPDWGLTPWRRLARAIDIYLSSDSSQGMALRVNH
jgi:hypothetical protein